MLFARDVSAGVILLIPCALPAQKRVIRPAVTIDNLLQRHKKENVVNLRVSHVKQVANIEFAGFV